MLESEEWNVDERWLEEWHRELRAAYEVLLRHVQGAGYPLFENLSFSQFVEFAYKHKLSRG